MKTTLAEMQTSYDESLCRAQKVMETMPQVFIPVQTFEGHGMVTRVMCAPAGTAMIGKRHTLGQHNFLMKGIIELATENGPVRLYAPEVIVSPPGTKRAAIAITDVVWATNIATDLTADEAERQLVIASDDAPVIEQEPSP
jgi:quercetin dioxygenase-like cupin family protein